MKADRPSGRGLLRGAARGCPCPRAGRSLRPSWASLTRMPPALRHPACAWLHTPAPGHGQPLAEFVPVPPDAEEPVGGHAQTSGECLRLSGDSQSARAASWSKTPRRRACPPPANQCGAASVAGRPRRPRPQRCGYETVRLPISSSTLSLSLPRIGHEAMRRIVTFRVSPRKRASSRSSSQRGPFTTSIRP